MIRSIDLFVDLMAYPESLAGLIGASEFLELTGHLVILGRRILVEVLQALAQVAEVTVGKYQFTVTLQ